jgi:hypothetical protein
MPRSPPSIGRVWPSRGLLLLFPFLIPLPLLRLALARSLALESCLALEPLLLFVLLHLGLDVDPVVVLVCQNEIPSS